MHVINRRKSADAIENRAMIAARSTARIHLLDAINAPRNAYGMLETANRTSSCSYKISRRELLKNPIVIAGPSKPNISTSR